ncbi:hypothetical protein [Nostoc spongiaeforme]|uniref:hypothetical protein n=1 Tax=Nostoc spongiaeforme TaxID=502487 RepID=UPI001F54C1F0|nr:hypothetical protein [Nostoc spongiaeforme]
MWLFQKAVEYESNHADGRTYTWTDGESLLQLLARKDEIIAQHEKLMAKEKKTAFNSHLVEALEESLNQEKDDSPCLVCHL